MRQLYFNEDDDEPLDDSEYEEDLQEVNEPPRQHLRQKQQRKKRHWLPIVVALILGAILGGSFLAPALQQVQLAYSVMPTYTALNRQSVAQVIITATRKQQLETVSITPFDNNHHLTSEKISCFIRKGEPLLFQGDVLNYVQGLNSLGLYTGFKLTRVVGCSINANVLDPNTALLLNNGDDPFFTQLQGHPWPLSTASANSSSFTLRPEPLQSNQQPETYNLYISQNGLSAELLQPGGQK